MKPRVADEARDAAGGHAPAPSPHGFGFEVGALGLQVDKDEHAFLCSGLSHHALVSEGTGDLRADGWLQRVVTV